MKRMRLRWVFAFGVLGVLAMASAGWAAYSSHQNDGDIGNFLTVYPFAKSTKLDDCVLCHPGGASLRTVRHRPTGVVITVILPMASRLPMKRPSHGYGQAYKNAGRDQNAIKNIESADSDGDSYGNLVEIKALTFPGDKKDYPGLTAAAVVVMNQERILKLKGYSQFYLNNASKSRIGTPLLWGKDERPPKGGWDAFRGDSDHRLCA